MSLMPLGREPWLFLGVVLAVVAGLPCLVARVKGVSLGKGKIVLAVLCCLITLAHVGMFSRRSLSLDGERLLIKTTLYTQQVPLSDIARIDLHDACQPELTIQVNGVGGPGIKSGWYRQGQQKYFVDIVRQANICIIRRGTPDIVALEVSDPVRLKRELLPPEL
ncbi:MAG: hypothetical protein Q4D91_02690 [Lautropia sp.]|nr:hypothetical protein [Lautropia sp.]